MLTPYPTNAFGDALSAIADLLNQYQGVKNYRQEQAQQDEERKRQEALNQFNMQQQILQRFSPEQQNQVMRTPEFLQGATAAGVPWPTRQVEKTLPALQKLRPGAEEGQPRKVMGYEAMVPESQKQFGDMTVEEVAPGIALPQWLPKGTKVKDLPSYEVNLGTLVNPRKEEMATDYFPNAPKGMSLENFYKMPDKSMEKFIIGQEGTGKIQTYSEAGYTGIVKPQYNNKPIHYDAQGNIIVRDYMLPEKSTGAGGEKPSAYNALTMNQKADLLQQVNWAKLTVTSPGLPQDKAKAQSILAVWGPYETQLRQDVLGEIPPQPAPVTSPADVKKSGWANQFTKQNTPAQTAGLDIYGGPPQEKHKVTKEEQQVIADIEKEAGGDPIKAYEIWNGLDKQGMAMTKKINPAILEGFFKKKANEAKAKQTPKKPGIANQDLSLNYMIW